MRERLKRLSLRGRAEFASRYGSNPAHLILLVLAAVVAAYAVIQWLHAPTPVRLLVWFGAALIGHDLIAAPLYMGVDKLLIRSSRGRPGSGHFALETGGNQPPSVPVVCQRADAGDVVPADPRAQRRGLLSSLRPASR